MIYMINRFLTKANKTITLRLDVYNLISDNLSLYHYIENESTSISGRYMCQQLVPHLTAFNDDTW